MKLGEIVAIQKGRKPIQVSDQKVDGYRRLLQIDDLRPNAPLKYCPPTHEEVIAQPSDVVIAWDGANAGTVSFGLSGSIGSTLALLRPQTPGVHTAYLGHFLLANRRFLRERCKGATIPHIDGEVLANLELPIPDVSEQHRIADVLGRVEWLRAQRRESISLLDALVESIFLDMFDDPHSNPMRWHQVQLGEIGDVQGGLQLSASRRALPLNVPYLRVANVHRNRLDLLEIKTFQATAEEVERTRLKSGDILIVEGHGNPLEIGRCAMWDGSVAECSHQNHLIRLRVDESVAVPVYVCRFLNSVGGRQGLLSASNTTSGLNTISVRKVRSCRLLLPPLVMQKEFAKKLASVDALIDAHQRASVEVDALFASLQHRAFRGEL